MLKYKFLINIHSISNLLNSNLVISPERSNNDLEGNDKDESLSNKVPCEFCFKMFDFDDILLHETGCEVTSVADDSDINRALNEYEQANKPRSSTQGQASSSHQTSSSNSQ